MSGTVNEMSDTLIVAPARTIMPLSVDLRNAARLLGLSQRTVRNMARAGELPSVQPAGKGGKLLFRVASLDQWLRDREVEAKSGARQEAAPVTE
jgi:excisionase family DNA binding protein